MSQQILFSSQDQSQQTFENFYPAENQSLMVALKQFTESNSEFQCFYIYGQGSSGKTHLLKATIDALANGFVFIDLKQQPGDLKTLINNTELKFLILDNFEYISDYESEIMLVYETLKQRAGKILISAAVSPKALTIKLQDIVSRLMSGQVFELKLLSDENKSNALKHRAYLRGFDLSEEVVNYVISRYPRDFKTLFGLLDKFDDASLSRQRKITIPFIKQLEKQL